MLATSLPLLSLHIKVEMEQQVRPVALLPPPPFCKVDPVSWFDQVESLFVTMGITADSRKYYYVVAFLEPAIVRAVASVVRRPPEKDPYAVLKARLLAAFGASTATRLRPVYSAKGNRHQPSNKGHRNSSRQKPATKSVNPFLHSPRIRNLNRL